MSNFFNKIKKMNGAYLIAEIGINHNGDMNMAKKLIESIKKAEFSIVTA